MRNIVFWSGILGVALFVVCVIFGGFTMDGYSHLHQFISESYASGAPSGRSLRFFGYIPSGILMTIFAFLAPTVLPKSRWVKIGFYGIAVFYGLGTVTTSIFPCDEGCNPELIDASISQLIHNFSGFLTYMLVPLYLLVIGLNAKKWPNGKMASLITLLCAVVSFCFVMLLFGDPAGAFKGLFQRIVEGSILFWIVYFSFYIKDMNILGHEK